MLDVAFEGDTMRLHPSIRCQGFAHSCRVRLIGKSQWFHQPSGRTMASLGWVLVISKFSQQISLDFFCTGIRPIRPIRHSVLFPLSLKGALSGVCGCPNGVTAPGSHGRLATILGGGVYNYFILIPRFFGKSHTDIWSKTQNHSNLVTNWGLELTESIAKFMSDLTFKSWR